MKKIGAGILFVFLGFQTMAGSASAFDPGQRRRPPRRTVVVVHKNWPLRRPLRQVVVHPLRAPFRVTPLRFLPTFLWAGSLAVRVPGRDVLIWEDGEALFRDEDWTEFGLNCRATGTRLWIEVVAGRVQFDWAEVVFGSGDAEVVDMQEGQRGPGYYELLNFRDGRLVDHVRMVARALTPEARILLRMEK